MTNPNPNRSTPGGLLAAAVTNLLRAGTAAGVGLGDDRGWPRTDGPPPRLPCSPAAIAAGVVERAPWGNRPELLWLRFAEGAGGPEVRDWTLASPRWRPARGHGWVQVEGLTVQARTSTARVARAVRATLRRVTLRQAAGGDEAELERAKGVV